MDQSTIKNIVEHLMIGSNIIPLIGNMKYEISLRNNSDVIRAIQIREKDIASEIENADAPWFVVSSISWVPKLLDSEKIKKAIGSAFSTVETPWYLLNVLKSNSHVLQSKHILKGIVVALNTCINFWLFIDHLKTVESLITHSDITKSIKNRAKSISSEIREIKNPITMIQSMKNFPELFEDESIQNAILDIVLENETPWEILHSLMDIESIADIHNHSKILELMERKGLEVKEQIEQTIIFPYGPLSTAVKIPELARTTAIRTLVCKMMATSNYDNDSSYVGLLHSSDDLASHPECQEVVSRILVASEQPWGIIEDVISVPERYDIWKEKYFHQCESFSNALSYRIDDIVEVCRLLKDDTIDFMSRRDLMLILDTVPDFANIPAIDENLAESILESENPSELIRNILENTSRGKKQVIQRAIASVIKQNKHLMEIIRSLEKGEFLLEVEEIQDAIRFQSDAIISAIERGESISFRSKLTSIIDRENLVNASIKRLADAKRPNEVIRQIFQSESLAKNRAIYKGIAKTIRTSENSIALIDALFLSSVPFDERWRALMDSEVMESIADQIRITKYPSAILQKIGWNEYEHLVLTNKSIMEALMERVDDIASVAANSRGFYDSLKVIRQIPVLISNEKIINAVANAIRDPHQFREISREIYKPMRENKEILKAFEDASYILLKLFESEEQAEFLIRDALHPVMLRNAGVVEWLINNINRFQNISFLIHQEILKIPRLMEELLRIIRTTENPLKLYYVGQLLSIGFLKKNPEYQDEFESIIEKTHLEVEDPWFLTTRLGQILKYIEAQRIQNVIKKRIPDIISAINHSRSNELDSIIRWIVEIPTLYSNDEIIKTIASRVMDMEWGALWILSRNENMFSHESIQKALIHLIKETPEIIEKLGIIHSEHMQSLPEFRDVILSRISKIVEEFLVSKRIDNTLRKLGHYHYIIQAPQFQDALRKRMDDAISLITRWTIDKIHITIGEFRDIDEILNEPTVYNLILQSIQESHNPWQIIDEITNNESLMNDEKIKQAMQSRAEFIARVIACVKNPAHIYSKVKDVEVIIHHPSIKRVVAKMNLGS